MSDAVDYAALAKQAGATDSQPSPAQSGAVDYAALAKQAGATDSTPATVSTGHSDPSFMQRVTDPDKTYDNLTGGSGVFNNATKAGVASILQGVGQGVKGLYDTVAHPIDTVKGLADVPGQVAQVPGAIRDINASADPAGTYTKVAGQTAGQAGGQALTALATTAVPKALNAVKNLRDIPAAISSDTVGTLNKVAKAEGLPESAATTARDAAGDLSKNFIDRAKSSYKVVDDAVGGDLKPVQEKITDLQKAIRVNKNVNPELADKFTTQLADQQQTLADLVEKAKASGVPDADKLMAAGDKDYSRGMAMKKVQSGVATASGQAKMGGHPHPGGFASQVDRLERTGVLQKALGPDVTAEIVQNAKTGLSRTRTIGAAKTVGKAVVYTAGAGLVGKLAVDALAGK